MAPVAKRLTISTAVSTSSSGTGCAGFLISSSPRSVAELAVLSVDEAGVFLEGLEALLPHGVLQLGDGRGVEEVILAARAELIVAASGQLGIGIGHGAKGVLVLEDGFLGEHLQIHPFNLRRRSREVLLDQLLAQADGLENLRAAVTLERRYSHFRDGL